MKTDKIPLYRRVMYVCNGCNKSNPCIFIIEEPWGPPERCPYENNKICKWEQVS